MALTSTVLQGDNNTVVTAMNHLFRKSVAVMLKAFEIVSRVLRAVAKHAKDPLVIFFAFPS